MHTHSSSYIHCHWFHLSLKLSPRPDFPIWNKQLWRRVIRFVQHQVLRQRQGRKSSGRTHLVRSIYWLHCELFKGFFIKTYLFSACLKCQLIFLYCLFRFLSKRKFQRQSFILVLVLSPALLPWSWSANATRCVRSLANIERAKITSSSIRR